MIFILYKLVPYVFYSSTGCLTTKIFDATQVSVENSIIRINSPCDELNPVRRTKQTIPRFVGQAMEHVQRMHVSGIFQVVRMVML